MLMDSVMEVLQKFDASSAVENDEKEIEAENELLISLEDEAESNDEENLTVTLAEDESSEPVDQAPSSEEPEEVFEMYESR